MKTLRLLVAAMLLLPLGLLAQKGGSYFQGGKLHVVGSSHQDIAWMDTPEACIQFRDEHMITPTLKRMAESETFCFSVEDALSLKEYLERHPDRFSDILKYTKQGRLEWGATFKQPYFSMYDGEALIRQTYFGRKWLKKMLPGCDFKTAWNQDVPGMAMQLPQILAKSGIPYYQFSRHQPGLYRWYSPDGSSILAWTPGQYECSGRPIRGAETEAARTDSFANILQSWDGYYAKRKLAKEYIFLYSFDFSTPLDWDKYMEQWNKEVKAGNPRQLPYIQYSTGTSSLVDLDKAGGAIDKLTGERPNVWLYIHGPTHHKALTAAREASRLLTAVEKFGSMRALLEGGFGNYPTHKLTQAWEDAIYPDHGWGGKNGHITDALFRSKYESARAAGKEMLSAALKGISEQIQYNKDNKSEYAVTVFNALSWERSDPVSFSLDVDNRKSTRFKLIDEKGKEVAFQQSINPQTGDSDHLLTFDFVAERVPSLGYRTYYLVPVEERKERVATKADKVYENAFYRITFGKGGIESLYDKELGAEVFNTEKFLGGELFTMQSIGNGAGEFTDVQQPDMTGFDKTSNHASSWQCISSGDVKDVFQTAMPFRNSDVVLRLVAYKAIKRIDFELDLNNFDGENWREFRLAFPVNMKNAKIAYEVPMGVVEVGKSEIAGAAGFSKPEQIYSTICKDVHPREVQDWFSASNGDMAVTISSSVAVFDWVDPTDKPVDYSVLQPLLLASRKSCHGEGNYYLQSGNHSFTFSLYSHKGSWKDGYRLGTQSNQGLKAQISQPGQHAGTLPDSYSFASIDGKGMVISTIKKCDDDDKLVLRYYEIEGNDTKANFKLFKNVTWVERTNMIEEEGKLISNTPKGFELPVGKYAIETFKLGVE